MYTPLAESVQIIVRDMGLARGLMYAQRKLDYTTATRHEDAPRWAEIVKEIEKRTEIDNSIPRKGDLGYQERWI